MNKFFRKYKVLFGIYTIWITIHIVLLVGFGGDDGDYFFPFTKYSFVETDYEPITTDIKLSEVLKDPRYSQLTQELKDSVKYRWFKKNIETSTRYKTDLMKYNDKKNKFTREEFLQRVRNKYPEYHIINDSTLYDAIMKKYPVYQQYIIEEKTRKPSELFKIETIKPLYNPFADLRYYDISEFIVYCFGPVVLVAYCYFLFLCFKKEKRDEEK